MVSSRESSMRYVRQPRLRSVLEKVAERPAGVEATDRRRNQGRDRDDVKRRPGSIGGHRIGDEHRPDGLVAQPGPGLAHEQPVAGGDDDLGAGAGGEQGLDRPGDRPTGRDHVVDDQAGPAAHVADDMSDHGLCPAGPPLVQDGDRGAEPVCVVGGHGDPSGIGRDDHHALGQPVAQRLAECRHRRQAVDGDVEEALDLGPRAGRV